MPQIHYRFCKGALQLVHGIFLLVKVSKHFLARDIAVGLSSADTSSNSKG